MLFRLRPSGGFRVLAARSHDREDISRPAERMSHFAVRKMVSSGRAVFVPDARRDRRYRPEEALQGKKMALSILVLPILFEDEVHGGIYSDHRFQAMKRPAEGDERVEGLVAAASLALALRERPKGSREPMEAAEPAALEVAAAGPGLEPSRSPDELIARHPGELERFQGLITANPDFRDIFDTVRSLSGSDLPVLFQGETGSGKSALARAMHEVSRRKSGPFVAFHCGAVPESLIESELLGHVKGAFTGAEADQEGVFASADGGTLFLDEVADMSQDLQKKLLRVLEDHRVRPLGAKSALQVDVRILSSTSRDLEGMVKSGEFRRDLYFRLKAMVLEVPPLRDRPEDLLPLAEHFLEKHASAAGRTPPRLDGAALLRLLRYPWPGNVRELENEMRRLVALGRDTVQAEHLAIALRGRKGQGRAGREQGESLEQAVEAAEREAIIQALQAARGNKSRAASRLGITRKSLYRRMARYRLGPRTQ